MREMVTAQTIHAHRVLVGHCHECLPSANRNEIRVTFRQVDALYVRNAWAALDAEQFHIIEIRTAEKHTRITQSATYSIL